MRFTLIALFLSCIGGRADDTPRGIHHAREVPGSPLLLASGLAWSEAGLVIADRKEKRLVALRPDGQFETLRKMTQPFGVAFDPHGKVLVSEKIDVHHIVRIGADNKLEVLVEGADAGTPHFLAVHKNGTIYWSGFPDGGTRSRTPDGKVTIHKPRIGHTFGIALSPQQDWLYVTSKLPDKGSRAVWRFPVAKDGTLGEGKPFFFIKDLKPKLDGLPASKDGDETLVGWIGRVQGLAIDRAGNFYLGGAESHTSGAAVAVVRPDGKEVCAMILGVPGNIASLALSGDERTLYITGAGQYRLHQVRFDLPGEKADAPKMLPQATQGDWPWWRGPERNGVSADPKAVTKWSAKENVVWTTDVPGRGHSSPIVCGKRVFLTTAEEATQKQLILAFDRQTGASLWSTLAHQGNFTRKYSKNSHASATQACDGERVFSVFINTDGLHVTATDLDGKILWQTRAGDFQSLHGYGSSPVLYKNLVIVNGDNVKSCYLTALDAQSGKVVWHAERKVVGKYGSYGTPTLAVLGNKVQLLQAGLGQTASYDPETGKLLWSCAGPAEVTANTLAFSATTVFSSGGFPEKELRAIRADGAGNVTQSHLAWKADKGITYVPSPLYHAGLLYVVNDSGIGTCFDADSGKQFWQERLQGNFSSSPILVGDLIYATSEAGLTSIFKASRKFELVGANSLQEPVMATPAVCGGQIFLRTDRKLYCLGAAKGK